MGHPRGIDILLISPQEERMHLSVRLDYRATNNEAGYEALIAGAFEINNARLKLYAEAFEKLKVNFDEVSLQKLPRADNQAADELAKLEGTRVTPFHLVYGGEAVVPVEVEIESDRVQQYDADNAERRQLELGLIDEARAKAAVRLLTYRQRMRLNYDRRVVPRAFQVGDLVWKKVRPVGDVSKVEAPWAGPFKIIKKLRLGAYYLEHEDGRQLERP
ncbi:uncharacterized protein LOC122013569 [Zingiber officinale]|uniref:uncharacterized protein LOC122013569 n=1 Tax=Zingiber officinale TaxID=94328 RepID=UPI001C4B9EA1|nr:uncharacterized protein LOC122013569 [Zingiber officinale]